MPHKAPFVGGTLVVMIMTLAMTSFRFFGGEVMNAASHSPVWNGWANVEKIGDSWSDSGFRLTKPQPGPDSPFGNSVPSYPDGTAIYGQHWFMYMTTEFNQSYIQTYNFARSSGTVNDSITPHGTDFIQEMHEDFLPAYGASGWRPSSTLFAMFFGVNDINLVADEWEDDTSMLLDDIFMTYSNLVEQLYQTGARNFLFLNMAPMDRAPAGQASLKPIIRQWNDRLQDVTNNVSSTYKDTSVFLFDLHTLFGQVLDDPTSFPQTANIKNTTENCNAYGYLMPGDLFDPACGVPLKEYLWLNAMHPTYPLHEALAAQIVKMLGG